MHMCHPLDLAQQHYMSHTLSGASDAVKSRQQRGMPVPGAHDETHQLPAADEQPNPFASLAAAHVVTAGDNVAGDTVAQAGSAAAAGGMLHARSQAVPPPSFDLGMIPSLPFAQAGQQGRSIAVPPPAAHQHQVGVVAPLCCDTRKKAYWLSLADDLGCVLVQLQAMGGALLAQQQLQQQQLALQNAQLSRLQQMGGGNGMLGPSAMGLGGASGGGGATGMPLPGTGVASWLNSVELDGLLNSLAAGSAGGGQTGFGGGQLLGGGAGGHTVGGGGGQLGDNMETSLTGMSLFNSLQLPQPALAGDAGQQGVAAAAAGGAWCGGGIGPLGLMAPPPPRWAPTAANTGVGGGNGAGNAAASGGGSGDNNANGAGMMSTVASGLDDMTSIEAALPGFQGDVQAALLSAAQQVSRAAVARQP